MTSLLTSDSACSRLKLTDIIFTQHVGYTAAGWFAYNSLSPMSSFVRVQEVFGSEKCESAVDSDSVNTLAFFVSRIGQLF